MTDPDFDEMAVMLANILTVLFSSTVYSYHAIAGSLQKINTSSTGGLL